MVSIPIDSFMQEKLSNIRSALEAFPPDHDLARELVKEAVDQARLDSQEMVRLRHEVVQYSELTRSLLTESGKLRTQLEESKAEGDRMDRERAEANRRCTAALIELKQAKRRLQLLESSVKGK